LAAAAEPIGLADAALYPAGAVLPAGADALYIACWLAPLGALATCCGEYFDAGLAG
jgi:hypothetical protein